MKNMSLLAARRVLLSQKTITNEPALNYFFSTKGNNGIDRNYEYIQQSKVPTMHFQKSLPRLPIPKLDDTCRRYLNALKPLLNDDEMQMTQTIVEKFKKEEGATLQAELQGLDIINKHTSYISKPWFDMYLKDRRPLPINYNPFLVFSPETKEQYNKQLIKATNLVVSSMRFLRSLNDKILEPDVFHLNPKKSDTQFFRTFTRFLPSSVSWYGAYLMNAYPLDMSQYTNLFNSTRIPSMHKDRINNYPLAKHIVVIRNGYYYAFDVLNKEGNIIPAMEIARNLQHILYDPRPPNRNSLGLLTTMDRCQSANTRKHLRAGPGNINVFKKIDSAAFVLALDDEPVGSDEVQLLRRYLHGGAENRWFDKSFSLIVTKDGYAGLNFEHSWGDGVAVLRYFQDIKKDISEKPQFHPEDEKKLSTGSSSVERLNGCVDDITLQIISDQKNKYDKWTNSLDIGFLMYEGFGKKECKDFGVSPDAVMQLVFQLAFYKQEARSVATYESCSTAAFKHGRTETLRPCTIQTKNLCSIMAKGTSNVSLQNIKKMIVDCSNAHTTLNKEAAMGQGFDRHLFALRKIAEDSGKKADIFEDSAYELINHNILSTSTLSSPVVIAGGFGPVVDDGFGIGYMIQDRRLGVVVTSYRDKRSAKDYVNSLEESFKDIHKVLLSK